MRATKKNTALRDEERCVVQPGARMRAPAGDAWFYWPTGRIVSAFFTDVTPATPCATSVALSTCGCSGTEACSVTAPLRARTVMLAPLRAFAFASAPRTLRASARSADLAALAVCLALG